MTNDAAAMHSGILNRLGSIGIGEFMREYWQRRPLLVRTAFPDFRPPVDRDRLLTLAQRSDVESRLVRRHGARWTLRHGPIAPRDLPRQRSAVWTLLVQGLDLVDDGAHQLLGRFRFVPDARLDDLMGSYASDGGGVGPHVDNYDVFVLQAQGRRRWRISRQQDLRTVPGQPLPLLAAFRPEREWILEPGDLLYLPPGTAHDGIAEGPCMTYSIGFRAPTYQELLDPWLANFAEQTPVRGRYADRGLRPVAHPGVLPSALISEVHEALSRHRPSRADTERFLLEYLSEPKAQVVFRPARPPLSRAASLRSLCRRGLKLDRRSRMLVGRAGVGINGEYFPAVNAWMPLLRRLGDERALGPAEMASAPTGLLALLHEWSRAGWIVPAQARS